MNRIFANKATENKGVNVYHKPYDENKGAQETNGQVRLTFASEWIIEVIRKLGRVDREYCIGSR